MGYAYEDEDKEVLESNLTSDISEDLTEKTTNDKQDERIIDQSVEVDEEDAKYVVDNLMKKEYVDERLEAKKLELSNEYNHSNLLDSEEDLEKELKYIITLDDEKYFSYYIGKNYNKITSKKFNFAAFFFGGCYLIYRKVYVIGILWLLINFVITMLTPVGSVSIYIPILGLIASYVSCGYLANSIILNHVASRILNYKIEDSSRVKEFCERRGGTSLIYALLAFLVISMLSTGVTYQYLNDQVSGYINNGIDPATAKKNEMLKRFSGTFKYDENVVIKDIISVNIPSEYSKSGVSTNYSINYQFGNGSEVLPISTVELYPIEGNEDVEEYIKAICDYYMELPSNIKQFEINRLKWYTILSTDGNKNTIYALTRKNDQTILYKFMYFYNYEEQLLPYYEIILNSIK